MISMRATAAGTRLENELLLSCARSCVSPERPERVRSLLREEIDWEYLLRTASRHGVLPLLYRRLNDTCPDAVPAPVLNRLRDDFHDNARRNLLLAGELLKLVSLLGAHGIPAIPYKGPVLAASLYGNLSLRQFCDLDIMVRREDVARAREMLMSHGYRPAHYPTRALETAHLEAMYHCEFDAADGRVQVELHWAPAWSYLFSYPEAQRLWERLETVSFAGKEILTFSPEDLLLLLCLHGGKHTWQRLGWICDVAKLLVVHKGMDWGWVMRRAHAVGSERMVFLGFFLASDVLGTVLPKDVLRRVRADPVVGSLAAWVRQRLFREAKWRLRGFERFLFYLKMKPGLPERILYCLGFGRKVIIPTVLEWELMPLPDFLFPVYYLLRPMRLAAKYWFGPVKRICSGNHAG